MIHATRHGRLPIPSGNARCPSRISKARAVAYQNSEITKGGVNFSRGSIIEGTVMYRRRYGNL
jgi:hypothetical protein